MHSVDIDTSWAAAVLAALGASLTDMTPVMNDIGEQLVLSTKDRFPTGIAPDGSSWHANSPVTLARKRDTRPLFGATKLLSQQINYAASATGVEWGSNLIYAGVQQFGAAKGAFGTAANGSSIPWGNIPARPFIGLSDEDQVNILGILEDYLETAADTAP